MTVPDYIISLAVLEEHRLRERRNVTASSRPWNPLEGQSSRVVGAGQRLRARLHTLVSTIDAPRTERLPGRVLEPGD